MFRTPQRPSAVLKEPEGVYESDSDCESDSGIDNLMYLLDGPAEESQKKMKHSQLSVTTNKCSDPPQSVVDPPQHVADVSEITESNHREKAPNTVKIENFDSRDGIWIQFRDGTAFGKYPTIVVPSNMCQYEQVLAILYTKNSDKEVQVPKFLHNAQVSDHVKMQATHPVSANKYWVKPSSLSEGRIIFKKKTWALGKKIKAFVSSGAVKFHFILVPFHNGKLRYDKAESTPDFEVRSKEQQNVTRARQGLINTVPRPRKRRRTAESEAKRIALESVRSDIASQHKENAKKLV